MADGMDFGECGGNEFGVAAGGNDGQSARGTELAFELEQDLSDQAAVAIDGTREHGVAR